MQAIHYLTLCFIIPPLLQVFAEQTSLAYEGKRPPKSIVAASSSHQVIRWCCKYRVYYGLARDVFTAHYQGVTGAESAGLERLYWCLQWWEESRTWCSWRNVNSHVGRTTRHETRLVHSLRVVDRVYNWVSLRWAMMYYFHIIANISVSSVYFLYFFVRRPRLILDFVSTFVLNHVILTTYYAAALPLAVFFWATILGGAFLTITAAEQLCVKRELREGLAVGERMSSDASGDRSLELEPLANDQWVKKAVVM